MIPGVPGYAPDMPGMEDARRPPEDSRGRPTPDTTAAAAFAPPPASARDLGLVLLLLVMVICTVSGVLLLFTAAHTGYALAVLAFAVLAAVGLGLLRRRRRSGSA
ncbi:hypothetical protein ACI784_20770 [Geodermatophilus sp. SYSU D01186]